MSKPCLYLAGPIDGVWREWATEWRAQVKAELINYRVIDPTEGKDLHHPDCNTSLYTPEEIVEADLAAIKQADVLLVDWRDTVMYKPLRVGTIMEICYAKMWNKRVYTFGNLRRGYWLRYHTDGHFDGLEEAIEYLKGESA